MYLPYSFIAAALFVAQVVTLFACNGTGFNATSTITVFTTITPTATHFCLGPGFTNLMPISQIGTAAPRNSSTLTPSSALASRPLLNLTDPMMAYKAAIAALASLTKCENATENFGFNTTKICSSGAVTAVIPSNTSIPLDSSAMLSTTYLPTLTSQPSDPAASTSTQVILVSASTGSDGMISTATIPSGSTSTTKSSATSVNSINTTTSTSAACTRLQPLRSLLWLNKITANACTQVLRGFGDKVDAEKAKAFLGAESVMFNAVMTMTTHPAATITTLPPTMTESVAATLLTATSLLGLAVIVSFLC